MVERERTVAKGGGGRGGEGRETGTIDSPVLWPTIIHGWILLTATNASGQASNLLGGSLDPATKPRRLTATTTHRRRLFECELRIATNANFKHPDASNLLIDAFIAINVSFTGLCPRSQRLLNLRFRETAIRLALQRYEDVSLDKWIEKERERERYCSIRSVR